MAHEQKKPTGMDPNRPRQPDQRPTGGSSGYQPGGSGQRQDDWSQRDKGGLNRPNRETDVDTDADVDEEDRA